MRNAISRFLFGQRDWLRPRNAGVEYLLLLIGIVAVVWAAQLMLFVFLTRGTHAADATPYAVILSAGITILVDMVATERMWVPREYTGYSFLMGGFITLSMSTLLGY